jgi:hypothetical protein
LIVAVVVIRFYDKITKESVYTIDMCFSSKILVSFTALFVGQSVLMLAVTFSSGTRDVTLLSVYCINLLCEAFYAYLIYQIATTGEYFILKVTAARLSISSLGDHSYENQ